MTDLTLGQRPARVLVVLAERGDRQAMEYTVWRYCEVKWVDEKGFCIPSKQA